MVVVELYGSEGSACNLIQGASYKGALLQKGREKRKSNAIILHSCLSFDGRSKDFILYMLKEFRLHEKP